ncbi:uncharacterized protein UDID_17907 [Ustilago sp. UG-2017a]|nr:uncharacterized protein UDID_17907 [Ustilago sp. UG-2017a]
MSRSRAQTRLLHSFVRGRAPETQVGLSRSSVTIQLCDSYCLGLGLEELVARQLSSCAVTAGGVVVYAIRWLGTINIDMKGMVTPRSGVSVDDDGDEVDDVGDEIVIPGPQWTTAFGSIYIRTANLLWAPSDVR